MEFTPKEIKSYHTDSRKRHAYYAESVEKYEAIDLHVEGENSSDLIAKTRPNETATMREYRMQSDEPLTKATIWRVFNSLNKIRKSQDWGIKFNEAAVPPRITFEETPYKYLMERFPKYNSIEMWAFQVLLHEMLQDANGFVGVHLISTKVEPNQYLRPVPIIYNSDDVIDYVEGEYFVMLSGEKNLYKWDYGKQTAEGSVYYVYTRTEVIRYVQINNNMDFAEDSRYTHNFGYVPCFQMRGVILEDNYKQTLCDSRLAPMIPYLNDMKRMQSDFKLSLTLHLYPTMWIYDTQVCKTCKGIGVIANDKGGSKDICPTCSGSGTGIISPGQTIQIKPTEPGANPAPTPPAGYILKDFEAIREINKYIGEYNYKALSAINFQFLDNTPLNISGLAKEVDRDELNVFVHSVAEDLVRVLDQVCKATIDYRYSVIVPNMDARNALRPQITVPESFDLLSADTMISKIKNLKDAGVDASIINASQVEYASKAFQQDPTVKERLVMKLTLDPYAGTSDENLLTAQQFGSVNPLDVRIHFNIDKYVDEAMQDAKFYDMTTAERKELIKKIAEKDTPEPSKNPLDNLTA
jgi:hypothetical protein